MKILEILKKLEKIDLNMMFIDLSECDKNKKNKTIQELIQYHEKYKNECRNDYKLVENKYNYGKTKKYSVVNVSYKLTLYRQV